MRDQARAGVSAAKPKTEPRRARFRSGAEMAGIGCAVGVRGAVDSGVMKMGPGIARTSVGWRY